MKLVGTLSQAEADDMHRIIDNADFSKVNPEDWK
jgi:hypothetical protein